MSRFLAVGVVWSIVALTPLCHAEQPFTNEALARGVNYSVGGNFIQFGSGLAFVDLDNDGDADLVLVGASTGKIGIYENDGTGHFTDRTASSGIPFSSGLVGVSAADYDGDGFEDLHFTRWVGDTDLLFRNNGDMTFTDVSVAAGVAVDGAGMASCWGDYNADGYLDLYVCYRTNTLSNTTQNKLFRNNGDGTFTDVAAALGVQALDEPTLLATFFDYDNDGDADLYLGTDKGSGFTWHNRLFRNDGGTFTDVTFAAGAEAYIDCMGIAVTDLDRNGFLDLYMTNVPQFGHLLLTANGDGTFTDQTAAAGVELFHLGWSTFFFDYNNDRWQDIFVTHSDSADALLKNTGVWPLTDVAPALGIADPGLSHCSAYADIDLDGDLDVAVSSLLNPIRLYINHEGENRHWVRLKIHGVGANKHAIGAQARVTHLGDTQLAEVRAGCNYKADNERPLHFGLGENPVVTDSIEVRWPNESTRRVLTNYLPDRTWAVWHPSRLGDADGNGSIDPDEIAEAIQVMLDTAGSPIEPGQEIYDLDGDCDVDRTDIIAMIATYSTVGGIAGSSPGRVPR